MADAMKPVQGVVRWRPLLSVRIQRAVLSVHLWRGVVGLAIVTVLWQFASDVGLPILKNIPKPTEVLDRWIYVAQTDKYWMSWLSSFLRVAVGFLVAQLIGIPLAMAMALSRTSYGTMFPVFEILRPIPPLAWVPASILFWPTWEMSITFVTFLGAFYTVVINVLGGVRAIDPAYIRAALSLGAKPRHVFWRIMIPAILPSVLTGMTVGIGITWEVVVAAEMIGGNMERGGLGFFTWESYTGGSFPQIIIGMISIGIAGYLSSAIVRKAGDRLMPWRKLF